MSACYLCFTFNLRLVFKRGIDIFRASKCSFNVIPCYEEVRTQWFLSFYFLFQLRVLP